MVCLDEIDNYVETVLISCMVCIDLGCRKHNTEYPRTNVSICSERKKERGRHVGRCLVSSRWWRTPLQKFFECHMEEAKRCAQQPSNGPQKNGYYAPDFPEKIAKNCLPLSLLWSSWVSVQCKFSHFVGGFAVLQISTSSLRCTGDLGRHRNASCYRDYSTQFKTVIKKANGFQVCCLQVS